MNEKFNKNAKVEQLTKMFLSCGEEKGLIVKDPFRFFSISYYVKFYTVLTPKMIWEPLNFGSFLDKIYLRLHENVLEIALKIVYEGI